MCANEFQINTPYIVHETIDGETIVMNLKDGNYYSFDGIGPAVWELILRGVGLSKMIPLLREIYGDVPRDLETMVSDFIRELSENEIIMVKTDSAPEIEIPTAAGLMKLKVFADVTIKKPMFHRYSDMRDILLLDPIHDVDAKGWPEPKLK